MKPPYPPTPTSSRAAEWRQVLAEYLGLTVALVILMAVFSLSAQHFFSAITLRTIANQIPSALLVATAMTYVLVIGEIDL